MRSILLLTVLVSLSGCASTAFEVNRAQRDLDYQALVASGLTAEQALGALTSDSLAASVPQTGAVLMHRERLRRSAYADSLRALDPPSRPDAVWLAAYDAELEQRRLEAERLARRRNLPADFFTVVMALAAMVYIHNSITTFYRG